MKKRKQEICPLVKLWFESSMPKQDFCNKHIVSYHSLNYWIKKYKREKYPVKSSPSTGFVPLTIKENLTRKYN